MTTLIERLKQNARDLHIAAKAGDATVLSRIHKSLKEKPEPILRRHCLAVVAREAGFDGWPHLVAVISGEKSDDFGTTLYRHGGSAHWNIWSASYDEAASIRKDHGGYLLPYKHQFFIVDQYFIETIGLNPDDPNWEKIGRDWVRPASLEARTALYEALLCPNDPP